MRGDQGNLVGFIFTFSAIGTGLGFLLLEYDRSVILSIFGVSLIAFGIFLVKRFWF